VGGEVFAGPETTGLHGGVLGGHSWAGKARQGKHVLF
jgi:hypothetical protein